MSSFKEKKIELSKDKRNQMISSIKSYFYNEREEELGDLAAGLILNFIIDELSLEFYNQGILDAYKYMSNSVEDLLSIQKY